MSFNCSKEEIENKRLLALDKIRARNSASPTTNSQTTLKSHNNIGPIFKPNGGHAKYEPYKRTQNNGGSPSVKVAPIFNGTIISGTAYLITEDRFEVNPSGFSEQLINVFKTIPSKTYDAEKRLWNFSLEHYDELQNKILPLKPHVVIGLIPQYVLSAMREAPFFRKPNLMQIEPMLRDKLLPFQVDGVSFGIEKKGRCLIADDMGLGKTYQALAIADYYREDWPLMIATTSSMRETWEKYIQELLPSVPMASILCVSSGKEKRSLTDKQAKVVIISYKMITLCTEQLIGKKFGVIILDESHLLKSYKAQSTECVTKLTRRAQRVLLLSGTPALSRPSELYTQLHIIEPNFFSGFTEYGKRYCAGKQTNFGWDMTGQSHLSELQAVLKKKFLIRRTKDQVLTTLKEKMRESVFLDSNYLNFNSETKEGLSKLALTYTTKKAAEKHAALLTFFCETAKVKAPAICKYIEHMAADSKEKFLVFAHHRIVLEAICYTLDENRVHYICIDGSTKSDQRSSLVDKFQVDDNCRCAVLSITAANAGITLTAAQLVLFAELHWNPGILTQAESRAHRIGQEGGVCIRYLLAKGTSDDFMWPMLENKLKVLNEVGLSKDTFGNTTQIKQSSDNSIMNYTIPKAFAKGNLIPGTNIARDDANSMAKSDVNISANGVTKIGANNTANSVVKNDVGIIKENDAIDHLDVASSNVDNLKTFFDDDEGDEMLASLNFI